MDKQFDETTVFRAFHAAAAKLHLGQPRIRVSEDNLELGPVLLITYHCTLNRAKRAEELGMVMDAAATALVCLAAVGKSVTGGIAISAHDGDGHAIHQAAITSRDAAAFVAKQITKEQFVGAWTIR